MSEIGSNQSGAFQIGEVWSNPIGYIYKVVGLTRENPQRAILRLGIDGSGTKRIRPSRSTQGWELWSPEKVSEHARKFGIRP